MRDSLGSNRFCEAVCAQWLAEATMVSRRLTAADGREDLAHETLLRVLEHPPARDNAGAWIQRICRNLHVDAWREAARVRQIGADGAVRPPSCSAEEEVLAQERRRIVRRALLALPRPQRRALILRFYGGWSFDRIAARLGMREATMRTRVHRALAALRAHVAMLRVWITPGALSLKPAIAVLIVFAASVDPFVAPRAVAIPTSDTRSVPTTGTRARVAHSPNAHRADGFELAQSAPNVDPHRARVDVAPRAETPARKTDTPAVQRYDFDEDQVTGTFHHPDEGLIVADLPARYPSLIELRREFLPEIVKTLEDF